MSDKVKPTGPTFSLATWQQRAGACAIDIGIVVGIYVVGLVLGSVVDSGAVTTVFWLGSLAFWVWQLYQQGLTGKTIGKGVVGIKLVRQRDAHLVGAGVSIGRGFLHVIDSLPCFAGWFLPLFDKQRQTIADKVVQTVVIEA